MLTTFYLDFSDKRQQFQHYSPGILVIVSIYAHTVVQNVLRIAAHLFFTCLGNILHWKNVQCAVILASSKEKLTN